MSAKNVDRHNRFRSINPLGERKTCEGILVIPFRSAFLIGLPVKSAFELLLTRVTEPRKNYL